ncbi:restriction endonuclease subunit S [Ruminobacter amylophilus]|uniref:restriction endonuclease subunit S n=1 Tax=Ruminobacter amylophilus TaxID=867 RepID=UPI00386DE005
MQRYMEYTASSAKWLGTLPSHWMCKKMGALFTERKTKVSDRDYAPLSVTKSGILPQLEHAAKTNDGDNRKLVCIGDFVINSRSDRKGSCGVSELDGSVSLINLVLTPRCGWNNRYVHYLLRSQPFSEEYYRNGRGIVADLWTTRYSEMKSILLPIPPRSEQDQIVKFLDWKVSFINKLINIKQRQINNFNEKLLVDINHLITHGIRLHSDYIKTEIDWAPIIPSNWTVSRIRNHFEIQKRIAGTEGFDVFSVTQQGLKVRDINLCEGQLATNYSGYQFVYPGEFAMNHMDLLTGGVGIADHLGVTSPDYRVFKLIDDNHCYAPYFLKVFQVCYRRHAFYRFGRGAANVGRWRLPATAFKNFEIPIPPFEEQIEIVNVIDKKEDAIKTAIESFKHQVVVLQEFKTRLIADVVTGKIDVRNIEIPEYEFVEEENDSIVADSENEEGMEE